MSSPGDAADESAQTGFASLDDSSNSRTSPRKQSHRERIAERFKMLPATFVADGTLALSAPQMADLGAALNLLSIDELEDVFPRMLWVPDSRCGILYKQKDVSMVCLRSTSKNFEAVARDSADGQKQIKARCGKHRNVNSSFYAWGQAILLYEDLGEAVFQILGPVEEGMLDILELLTPERQAALLIRPEVLGKQRIHAESLSDEFLGVEQTRLEITERHAAAQQDMLEATDPNSPAVLAAAQGLRDVLPRLRPKVAALAVKLAMREQAEEEASAEEKGEAVELVFQLARQLREGRAIRLSDSVARVANAKQQTWRQRMDQILEMMDETNAIPK